MSSDDRHRRSRTATTSGGRTPPSSIVGDIFEESAEEWRLEAEKARRERREAENGRKKAEDARDEAEERAKKHEEKIRRLLKVNRDLEERLRARGEQNTPAPPLSTTLSTRGRSQRNETPHRGGPVDPVPSRMPTPARVPSPAPGFSYAGGEQQPDLNDRISAPPPARAAAQASNSRTAPTCPRTSQPQTQCETASGRQQASTSGHSSQSGSIPDPHEGFATPQNMSPALESPHRTPRQIQKAVPARPQPQVVQPEPRPRREAPLQSSTVNRVPKLTHTPAKGYNRLDAKNFMFLLENHQDILDVGKGWDEDPPFDHTYPFPGAGDCKVAIGDVIQYYPQYKSWDPCHKIPHTNSHIPHHTLCWYGIVTDYEEVGPSVKVFKKEGVEIDRVEEPGGVENVGIMWLYSQDELRDMYRGRFGEDKLPYKNDPVLKKLSETEALDSRDRILSTDIDSNKIYGLIRTVPKKDVGINDGADGKIVIRFDLPWLVFNGATKKRGRNGKGKGAYVSQKKVDVDLSPIEDEEGEPDSDVEGS